MRAGWLALRDGLRRVGIYWPALLAAYLVNVLSALALALFPAAGMLGDWARRPSLAQAAGGISAGMVVDFLGSGLTNAMQGIPSDGRSVQLGTLWLLVTALVLPLLAGLPAAFLTGGLALTYVETPAAWRWRRFFWACWHWFGAFILLGLAQALATAFVATALAAPMVWAAVKLPWLNVALALVLGVTLALLLAWFEVAAVLMVSQPTRNFARALGQALRRLRSQAGPLAATYALALGALTLAHVLYTFALWPRVPLAAWPLVLFIQQAFVLTRLSARLWRLSAVAALCRPAAA